MDANGIFGAGCTEPKAAPFEGVRQAVDTKGGREVKGDVAGVVGSSRPRVPDASFRVLWGVVEGVSKSINFLPRATFGGVLTFLLSDTSEISERGTRPPFMCFEVSSESTKLHALSSSSCSLTLQRFDESSPLGSSTSDCPSKSISNPRALSTPISRLVSLAD